jgi:hypothetical protein
LPPVFSNVIVDHELEILHLKAKSIDLKCRKGDLLKVFRLSERMASLKSDDPHVLEMTHLLVATPGEDEEAYVDYLRDLAT